tara:strand:+ start:30 stop:518 length:489 start_codon:yes stop_codon:yes gene_type:complete
MVVITPGLAWTFTQEVPKLIAAMDPDGTTTVGRNARVLNAVNETVGMLTDALKSPSIGDELKIKKGKEGMPINPGPKAPKGDPGGVPKGDPGGGTISRSQLIEEINKGGIGEWGNSGLLRIGSNKRDTVGASNNRASLFSNYYDEYTDTAYDNTDDSLFYSL